ncbi:MAG: rhodanese-like domain-containing protein [Pseudodesulfovibrio sp.]
MKNRTFPAIIIIVALLFCTAQASLTTELHNLTPEQSVKALAETPGLIILDIRTPEEFNSGHIKGAENIDFYGSNFQARIDSLDKTTPYFIYCRSGRRSGVTVEYMQQAGFATIMELTHGINGWKKANQPLIQ